MKYIKQTIIILFISFLGEILHALLPLPIPASIYGIALMLLCLVLKWIPLSEIEETGRFLIEIMPLMFIPAAVGLIDAWAIIKPSWPAYIVITVVSTIVVMSVSGWVTQLVLKYSHREG